MFYMTGDTHGKFSPLLAGTLYGVSRDGEKQIEFKFCCGKDYAAPISRVAKEKAANIPFFPLLPLSFRYKLVSKPTIQAASW